MHYKAAIYFAIGVTTAEIQYTVITPLKEIYQKGTYSSKKSWNSF
jgi:hypothetical protein